MLLVAVAFQARKRGWVGLRISASLGSSAGEDRLADCYPGEWGLRILEVED